MTAESENAALYTWLGKAPPIAEGDLVYDLPKFVYPSNFVDEFNANPCATIKKHNESNPEFDDFSYLGPFLFLCNGVFPRAISEFVFSNMQCAHDFLYYYFSAVCMDFMPIAEALRFTMSRIAFPNQAPQIQIILNAFSDAYRAANASTPYNHRDITVITISCVICSIFHLKEQQLDFEEFMGYLSHGDSISRDAANSIFSSIDSKAIPIFLTFGSTLYEPNYHMNGSLKKIGRMFKAKSDRPHRIEGFFLRYYQDLSMSQCIGEVDLTDTFSSYVEATKKDPEHLLIMKLDGSTLGSKIKKGALQKSHRHDYIAYGDKATLLSWIAALNYVSFWSILKRFI